MLLPAYIRISMKDIPDITAMRRRPGESEQDFWQRKVNADPDIIGTKYDVEVRRRPDETDDQYRARFLAAVPPLNEEQKKVLRAAGDELWQTIREQWRERRELRKRRKRDRRQRGDRRKKQIPIKGPDRKCMVDR